MFETFIDDTQTFLKALGANNKRGWFVHAI